jgi:hypothetical protein
MLKHKLIFSKYGLIAVLENSKPKVLRLSNCLKRLGYATKILSEEIHVEKKTENPCLKCSQLNYCAFWSCFSSCELYRRWKKPKERS